MPTDKQRRAAERRRLQRQVQRRAQRNARRRRFALIASIVGVLVIGTVVTTVVIATGNDKSSNAAGGKTSTGHSPTTPASSTTSSAAPAYPCTWTKSGTASKKAVVPSTTRPPKTGSVTVSVQTTRGPMTFMLNRNAAPCAVASFVALAQQKFFDSTPCHRLTTTNIYVLQCGDPTGTGRGGPGYSFKDELTGKEKYTRGVLAMANSGPNTNGSQFFIVYKDSLGLSPNYTIFGKVSTGMQVIDRVAAKGSTNSNGQGDGKPKLPITLTKLTVAK